MQKSIAELMNSLPQKGKVVWIGLRPTRAGVISEVKEVKVNLENGLEGDHYQGNNEKKRQVTLIQSEHLDAVASILQKEKIDPALTRRNIVVRGINLLSLKDRKFLIGTALLEMTGECHPCSRMEENLGEGGYNAMRGHGGITARVIREGIVRVDDFVSLWNEDDEK